MHYRMAGYKNGNKISDPRTLVRKANVNGRVLNKQLNRFTVQNCAVWHNHCLQSSNFQAYWGLKIERKVKISSLNLDLRPFIIFSVEVKFQHREHENLGKNLSLLLIFKFPSATEIDEICRGAFR